VLFVGTIHIIVIPMCLQDMLLHSLSLVGERWAVISLALPKLPAGDFVQLEYLQQSSGWGKESKHAIVCPLHASPLIQAVVLILAPSCLASLFWTYWVRATGLW